MDIAVALETVVDVTVEAEEELAIQVELFIAKEKDFMALAVVA